ncbi:SPOR domain-containing protein [Marinovum sp.]|uniref:SPOR domain-containing protein n=1 Tax=Marinovum sp. TaxID=2024839 RepID=UPI003A8D6E28
MKKSICTALAVAIGFSANVAPVAAQISADLATPAELPPASFTGRQYVDSRGCMYIRAGIDGNVTWVPRVDRDRQVICGQTVSAPAAAPARVVEAPAPVAEPAPAPATVATRPAPRPVVAARPAPAPARVAAAPTPRRAAAPAQRRAVAVAPKPAAAPMPRLIRIPKGAKIARRAPAAAVNSAPAPKVIVRRAGQLPPNTVLRTPDGLKKGPTVVVRGTGQAVRVGQPPVKVFTGTSGVLHVTDQTRIAPKAAYVGGASVKVPVPHGYERAFDDGRLSTTRAHQTLDGRRKMLLTWTNTVPQRLVDQYTGEEVSHYFPDLRYPYRSMKEQQAAGFVSSRGEAPKAAPQQLRKSTPKVVRKQVAAAPASHRYIQVGTFSTMAKAQAAIGRLQAAGLSVRVKDFARNGAAYRTVLVGPFARQDALSSALNVVRNRVGYRSAQLRD